MLIEGNTTRISMLEATDALHAAYLAEDHETADFLWDKREAVGERMQSENDDGDFVEIPQDELLIEFPTSARVVELLGKYIASGAAIRQEIDEQILVDLNAPPKRPKPEVKARHRAPHLRLVQTESDE